MQDLILRASGVRVRGWHASLIVAFSVATCAVATQARAESDVLHYNLELKIAPDTMIFDAHADVVVEASTDGAALSSLELDFEGFTLSKVAWNGVDVPYARDSSGHLTLTLPEPLQPGESGRVSVDYQGAPTPCEDPDLGTLGVLQDQTITYAVNVTHAAHYWFPCRDRLDDKASVDLALILPAGFLSAGPGHLESVTVQPDGLERHQWRMSQEVTPYLLSFAFSPRYQRQSYSLPLTSGPLPADIVLLSDQWPAAWADLEPLPRMMDWLQQRYGLFPYDQAGIHEVPYPGAVEQPGNIAMGSLYFTGQALLSQYFAHEFSHSWFQGLVTIRTWNDIFLSESIATWHELLWFEEEDGIETADLMAWTYLEAYLVGVPAEGYFALSDPDILFSYTVYMKGAVVWRLLEHLLGRDALIEVLRSYLADPDGISDLDGFFAELEATHNPDVSMFRSEWLDRAGLPDYRFGWRSLASGDGYGLSLRLSQVGANLYTTPIDVEVAYADGSTETVTLRPTRADYTEVVCLKDAPSSVTLDPRWMVPRLMDGEVVTAEAPSSDACTPVSPGCPAQRSPVPMSMGWLAGVMAGPAWILLRRRLLSRRK